MWWRFISSDSAHVSSDVLSSSPSSWSSFAASCLLVAYILCDVSFVLVSCSQLFITVLTDLIFLLLRKTIFLFKQSLNKILSVTPPSSPYPSPLFLFCSLLLRRISLQGQVYTILVHYLCYSTSFLVPLSWTPRWRPPPPVPACLPPLFLLPALPSRPSSSSLSSSSSSLPHSPTHPLAAPYTHIFLFSPVQALSLTLSRHGQPFKVSPWNLLKKNKIWSFSHCQTYFWSLCPLRLGIFSSICLLLLSSLFLSDSVKSSGWCFCCRNC